MQCVRGLEHERAATGTAVREQQGLEDLVGPVRGEDPLGGLADVLGDPGPQIGGAAIGIAIAGRRRPSAPSHASTNAGGGANGLSFVLSRTGTSSCGEW